MKARHSDQPGRISLWLPALFESTGGIQSFSQELLRACLTERPRCEFDVFIKNDRRGDVEFLKRPAVSSHCFGRWPDGPLRTIIFVLSIASRAVWRRPKLIIVGHAHFARAACWLSRVFGIPFWVILHGVEVWDEKGARIGGYLHRADRLLAVSRFTRDKVVKEQGLDPGLFRLLPNTVDGRRFRPAPKSEALRKKLGLPSDARVILTVCRLIRDELYKGYDQIIAALPEVKARVPKTYFVLAGSGDDAARVQDEVTAKKLEGEVILTGYVPEDQLVDYYNLCDVFAMPSRREGFGIVFLEALACGKPVLGGNGDGATEALRDGELGVLVNPENPDELAKTLIMLLDQSHPHRLVFQPDELRRRALANFGREQFARRLDGYLAESLGSDAITS